MQQFPDWLYQISGVLANKKLYHTITPSSCTDNAAHVRTLQAATNQDPTLESFTSHTDTTPNAVTHYYGNNESTTVFPGSAEHQFNASRLIRINLDPSLASSVPRTRFAYDLIKHLRGMYQAHASNPTIIDEKIQTWLNLQMTSSQSIHAYWLTVATQLADLTNLRTNNPQVQLHTQFPQFKRHVINRLHSAFGSVKDNLLKNNAITNESQLLSALVEQSQLINWVPSNVALTTSSSLTGGARRSPERGATRTVTTHERATPYQQPKSNSPPHALEQRDRPQRPCTICTAANVTNANHWKTQCYRNPNYLSECLKPLPANITLLPFNRLGRSIRSHPDILRIYQSRSLPTTTTTNPPRQQYQQQAYTTVSTNQDDSSSRIMQAINTLTATVNSQQEALARLTANQMEGAAPSSPTDF
ncbi:hypothetical protein HDU80_011713 [Chytriomyces hyalinus]|nr:hypothetical protein HDU80_011713 [Chytriomyces hyalinus]